MKQFYLLFMEEAFSKIFIICNILKEVVHFTLESGKMKTLDLEVPRILPDSRVLRIVSAAAATS